jgi:hypothetical protein
MYRNLLVDCVLVKWIKVPYGNSIGSRPCLQPTLMLNHRPVGIPWMHWGAPQAVRTRSQGLDIHLALPPLIVE